jgi:ribosome-associated toxin RatA of RatAB toxin-antitoxin module
MPVVTRSILINAPPEELFALSQDYGLRRQWDPFVREMRFLDGALEAGLGVRVWVKAWTGLTMVVGFVSFHPPDSVAMKMLRGPFFFKQFAGTWLFKAKNAGTTEVTFRYGFTVRWHWLGMLLNPIIKMLFTRDVKARLEGMKRAVRDGILDRLGEPCT